MAPTAAASDRATQAAAPRGVRRALLPLIAVVAVALAIGVTLAVAGDTLGYDFRAYWTAGSRVLAGQHAYDTSFESAGGFGLFYYPPAFLPLILPFALLPEATAVWAWTVALVAALCVGIALLPIAGRVRWLVLLLAALSWPVVYAIKLGQVGPILVLLFAAGWRWIERPGAVGVTAGLGAAIKVQPGLLLVWALLRHRFGDVVAGVIVLVVLSVVAVVLTGAAAWTDFVTLITRVSDPITTPHNLTPGAVAYQAGMSRGAAAIVQLVSTGAAAVIFVMASLRWPAVASYLVAVVVSQLVSPVFWDHYAMLLLLPVAWLLDRGHWWAVLVPLATSLPLVGVIPTAVYPFCSWAVLIALVILGQREALPPRTAPQPPVA